MKVGKAATSKAAESKILGRYKFIWVETNGLNADGPSLRFHKLDPRRPETDRDLQRSVQIRGRADSKASLRCG